MKNNETVRHFKKFSNDLFCYSSFNFILDFYNKIEMFSKWEKQNVQSPFMCTLYTLYVCIHCDFSKLYTCTFTLKSIIQVAETNPITIIIVDGI